MWIWNWMLLLFPTEWLGLTVSPERDLDTLVEPVVSMETDSGTNAELSCRDETNPFRIRHQPPSFEQILAQNGLRLSDLAIVSLPNPRCVFRQPLSP